MITALQIILLVIGVVSFMGMVIEQEDKATQMAMTYAVSMAGLIVIHLYG